MRAVVKAVLTSALLVAACSDSAAPSREAFVINTLAEDNYIYALRSPELVTAKLAKMQRDPFDWLRGTPAVYWHDVTDPGSDRIATAFGSPASSRVLLCADPHPENIGTFRASDGTLFVDWNDFDSSGYGPFEGDVRRLAAGLMIATRDATADVGTFVLDPAFDAELAHRVATGYAAQIAELAAGMPVVPLGTGNGKLLDKLIAKAIANGDAKKELSDTTAVDASGARYFLTGDLDPVADDGVIENRQTALDPITLDRVTQALAPYLLAHPELGPVIDTTRRFGSGVSSYAAYRYYVLFADEHVVELKEERDGIAMHGVPQLEAAEWASPAVRVVDVQHRLLDREGDPLLASADVGALSLRIHDHTAYQRGVASTDLGALYTDPTKRSQLSDLAEVFGRLLARAHGTALTQDGVHGWTVIAPLLGDGLAFGDEVSAMAQADAAQILSDWQALRGEALAPLVVPRSFE